MRHSSSPIPEMSTQSSYPPGPEPAARFGIRHSTRSCAFCSLTHTARIIPTSARFPERGSHTLVSKRSLALGRQGHGAPTHDPGTSPGSGGFVTALGHPRKKGAGVAVGKDTCRLGAGEGGASGSPALHPEPIPVATANFRLKGSKVRRIL